MQKPTPVDIEIILEPKRYIVSETDEIGKITYCNDYFKEIAGYNDEELVGSPHSIVRHPDMPRVVFKLLWETISQGKNINAVIKNLAKDGRYYWVFTEFESRLDVDTKKTIGYTAHRKTVSKYILETVEPLYKELLKIEKEESIEASEKYLNDFIHQKGEDITFANMMEEIHRFY